MSHQSDPESGIVRKLPRRVKKNGFNNDVTDRTRGAISRTRWNFVRAFSPFGMWARGTPQAPSLVPIVTARARDATIKRIDRAASGTCTW